MAQSLSHIRKNRLEMTQAAFAALADVAQSTVSRWERGELSPSLEEVNRIIAGAKVAKKIDLRPEEFFGGQAVA